MTGADSDLLTVTAIACVLTFALFLAGSVIVYVLARRRYARAVELHGADVGSATGGMAWLFYAGTLVVGMVGIGAGFVLMRDAKTAKQGYVCVLLGIAHVLVLVALTCAGVYALVRYYGPSLPGVSWLGASGPMIPSALRASGGA